MNTLLQNKEIKRLNNKGNNIVFGNFNKNFTYEVIAGKKRRIYTTKRKAKYYYTYVKGVKRKRYLNPTQYLQLRRKERGLKQTKKNKKIAVRRRKNTKIRKIKRIQIIISCHACILESHDIIYQCDYLPIFSYVTRTQIGYVDYFDLSRYSTLSPSHLYNEYLSQNKELFNKKNNIFHINKNGKRYQSELSDYMSNHMGKLSNYDNFKSKPYKLLKIHSSNEEGIIDNDYTFSEPINGIYVVNDNNELVRYVLGRNINGIFLKKVDIDFKNTKTTYTTLKEVLEFLKNTF